MFLRGVTDFTGDQEEWGFSRSVEVLFGLGLGVGSIDLVKSCGFVGGILEGYASEEDTLGSAEVVRLLETWVILGLGLESGDTDAYSVGDTVGE